MNTYWLIDKDQYEVDIKDEDEDASLFVPGAVIKPEFLRIISNVEEISFCVW